MSESSDGEVRESRRYRGQNRAQRREARRQRLLDTGLDTFGTSGFSSSTIERLCADAQVTIRSFYEEFDSREALLAAVYDDTAGQLRDAVREALTTASTVTEQVEATLRAFVHVTVDDPRRGRVLCLTSVAVSDAMEQRRRSILHSFAAVIDRLVSSLTEDRTPAQVRQSHMVAYGLIGASSALVVEYLSVPDPPGPETLYQAMRHLWLAGLAAASGSDVPPLVGVSAEPAGARRISA